MIFKNKALLPFEAGTSQRVKANAIDDGTE